MFSEAIHSLADTLNQVIIVLHLKIRDKDQQKISSDPDPAQLKKKIRIWIRPYFLFVLISHHFKLEFVDAGLYFV